MMEFEDNTQEVVKALTKAEQGILNAIGLLVMGKAVENLRKPRPHRGGGSFPTYDTGNLGNSITYKVTDRGVEVGTPVEYGVCIEKGVKAHWTSLRNLKDWCRRKLGDEKAAVRVQRSIASQDMPAMPWLEPAFMENVDEIQKVAGQEVKIVFSE